jgi:hypothetical protein
VRYIKGEKYPFMGIVDKKACLYFYCKKAILNKVIKIILTFKYLNNENKISLYGLAIPDWYASTNSKHQHI